MYRGSGRSQLRTSLVIYNTLGQVVRELYAGNISPGSFEVQWDGRTDGGTHVPSGIYFAIFRAESYQETIRLILLK
jgi:flagellar hook assembly protein FlgD